MHGPQNGQIDFAAANHGKTVVAAKDGCTGDGGHGLLARIHQIRIHMLFSGIRPYAHHAVFRLQPNFDV